MRTNRHQIRTPEGIVFSQTLAGPVSRFAAWLFDGVLMLGLMMALGTVLSYLGAISAGLSQAVMILTYFAVLNGYRIACEWWWRGQTLGKRLLRLRVVDAEGLRLHFSQVVIRNLLRAVDMLPGVYMLGGLAAWFSPRGQRLGDLAANTLVVHLPQIGEPDLDQVLAGKYNSLRAQPHLAARLRQRVSPAEAALALQALVRREEFEPLARVELFAELSAHFRAKMEFPPETVEHLADEQLVRNVVDVVYRPRAEAAA